MSCIQKPTVIQKYYEEKVFSSKSTHSAVKFSTVTDIKYIIIYDIIKLLLLMYQCLSNILLL